jgi:hypothetical protein
MGDIANKVEVAKKVENEEVLKRMKELKEMIEKNTALAAAVESEPRHVLAKTYIEGNPNTLKNLLSSMLQAYSYDNKGNAIERCIAVTLMVEDITPKKKQ